MKIDLNHLFSAAQELDTILHHISKLTEHTQALRDQLAEASRIAERFPPDTALPSPDAEDPYYPMSTMLGGTQDMLTAWLTGSEDPPFSLPHIVKFLEQMQSELHLDPSIRNMIEEYNQTSSDL